MNKYTNFNELPLILKPMDVAAILGISKNNAYAIIHSQGFPAIKVGKQYRILRNNFIAWLESQSMVNAA